MDRQELDLWKALVVGAIGLLTFLGLWELFVRVGLIEAYALPMPTRGVPAPGLARARILGTGTG